MVRFARAEGSKGSNKKQLEEPTPWIEMVSQFESNKKKRKKNQEEVESKKNDVTAGHITKKKKTIDNDEQQTNPQKASQTVKKQKTDEKKEKQYPMQAMQSTVKKNKKEKKKGIKTSEPEYTITPEGKRVKVFRDGTARTWFDLPYEESDTMTRYEGMWVKKTMVGELDRLKAILQEECLDKKEIMKKMMKAKRKAHRELRIELIYQQKSLVSEATSEKGINAKQKISDIKSTKKKKKQKPHMIGNGSWPSSNTESNLQRNSNKSSLYDEDSAKMVDIEEQTTDDDGDGEDDVKLRNSQTCDREQKKWEKNDADGKIKKKNEMETDKLEVTPSQIHGLVSEEGQDNKNLIPQVDGKMKKKKKSKRNQLQTDVEPFQNNQIKREDNGGVHKEVTVTPQADDKAKKKKKRKVGLETEGTKSEITASDDNETGEAESFEPVTGKEGDNNDHGLKGSDHASNSQEDFEENELMTKYDGYWVLRDEVESLEAAKKMELESIYAARKNENNAKKEELTQEEQLVLQRAMKKRKRFHHRKLLQKLSKTGKKVNNGKTKKGDKKEDDSGKVVKFDGFWVKKEAAERLHRLRKKLYKEGLSQQEVDTLIQKERRKEERVLKNERKLVCLNCRQPGHMVSACPNILQAEGEGQPSICYTCGSTEHTSSSCNLKKGSEKSFSFATCYICGETGHISRQCPDNPRGLYPKGGACRGCGSVEHLAKDCPDLQKEKVESSIRVGRLKGEELEGLDEDADEGLDQDASPAQSKLDRPKVVKF